MARRYPILIFPPHRLFWGGGGVPLLRDGDIVYNPWVGEARHPTWEMLTTFLAKSAPGDVEKYPDLNVCKTTRGAWAIGRYVCDRKINDNWLGGSLMGFDIDRMTSISAVMRAFRPFQKIVHTTLKHTSAAPRARVIIPLKDECTDIRAFRRVHAHVVATLTKKGYFADGDIDRAGGDASRAWWLPMYQPGVEPLFTVTDGEPLDLDAILKVLPPEPDRTRVLAGPLKDGGFGAIMSVVRQMSTVDQGQRHNALVAKVKWLRDIGCDVDDVVTILAPAVSKNPHHQRKVETQIRSAMRGEPKGVLVSTPLGAPNIGLEEFESQL